LNILYSAWSLSCLALFDFVQTYIPNNQFKKKYIYKLLYYCGCH
jgi:hypothetical protein